MTELKDFDSDSSYSEVSKNLDSSQTFPIEEVDHSISKCYDQFIKRENPSVKDSLLVKNGPEINDKTWNINCDELGKNASNERPDINHESLPEGGWGWVCVFSGFMINFLFFGVFVRSFGLIYLAISDKFPDIPDSVKAWILSLLTSFSLTLSPLASILGSRFCPRKVIFIGGVFAAAGLIFSSFTTSPYQLIFTLGVLCGIGGSLSTTLVLAIIGSYFEKTSTIANGFCLLGTSAGGFIMPYAIDFSIKKHNLDGSFLILGAVVLNILPCAMLMRLPQKCHAKSVNNAKKQPIKFSSLLSLGQPLNDLLKEENAVESKAKPTNASNIRFKSFSSWIAKHINLRLLKKITFLSTTVANCFKICSVSFFIQFLPSLLSERGITAFQTSILLSIIAAADCVARLLIGWFVYKTSSKSWLLCGICFGLNSLVILTVAVVINFNVTAVCCAIFGFFFGCEVCLLPSLLADDFGSENLISAFGLIRLFFGISVLLSAPFLGWIKDRTGSYSTSYYVISFLLFVSCIVTMCHPVAEKIDEKRHLQAKQSQCA